jgi:hypothetical protein
MMKKQFQDRNSGLEFDNSFKGDDLISETQAQLLVMKCLKSPL